MTSSSKQDKRPLEEILSVVPDDEPAFLSTLLPSNPANSSGRNTAAVSLDSLNSSRRSITGLSPSRLSILQSQSRVFTGNRSASLRSSLSAGTSPSGVRSSHSLPPLSDDKVNPEKDSLEEGISVETLRRVHACKEYLFDRYTRLLKDDTIYNPLLVVRWKESTRSKSLFLPGQVARKEKCIWMVTNDDYFQFERKLSMGKVDDTENEVKDSIAKNIDKGRILLNEFLATEVFPVAYQEGASDSFSRTSHIPAQRNVSMTPPPFSEPRHSQQIVHPSFPAESTSPLLDTPRLLTKKPIKLIDLSHSPEKPLSPYSYLSPTTSPFESAPLPATIARNEIIHEPSSLPQQPRQPQIPSFKQHVFTDSQSSMQSQSYRRVRKRFPRPRLSSSLITTQRSRQRQDSSQMKKPPAPTVTKVSDGVIGRSSPEVAFIKALQYQEKKIMGLSEQMTRCLEELEHQKSTLELVVFSFTDPKNSSQDQSPEWDSLYSTTQSSQTQYIRLLSTWKETNIRHENTILSQRTVNGASFEKMTMLRSQYDRFQTAMTQYRSRTTMSQRIVYKIVEYVLIGVAYIVWFFHWLWRGLVGRATGRANVAQVETGHE